MAKSALLVIAVVAALVAWPSAGAAAREIDADLDSAMEQDPLIEFPDPIVTYSTKHIPLWVEALKSPEADLKRQAAMTIARAQRHGMPGLEETIAPLLAEWERPDQHRIVRLAAAQALVALEARHAAAALRRQAAASLELAQVVEPALARWDDQPSREVWLSRLSAPDVRRQSLVLAIDGLGTVREPRAAEPLLALAVSKSTPPDVRLRAARAVARMTATGLESTAQSLSAARGSGGTLDRLVGATLVSSHSGEPAQSLLQTLGRDEEPAVAAIALRRLLEIAPEAAVSLAPDAIRRTDAPLRQLGAEALLARPTDQRMAELGLLLDDPHPDIRRHVRRGLVSLADDGSLREPILNAGMGALAADGWRGNEQAALLLVALAHQPAIGRLVELLDHPRPEVLVTAAWALRRLEARDVLEAMLSRAERAIAESRSTDPDNVFEYYDARDLQVAQLFEAFATMNYRPAEPLLRKLVPKGSGLIRMRARAIWTLGHFHAGQADPELSQAFSARLADVAPPMPEMGEVRLAAAISLGRMRAESELPVLRQFDGTTPGDPIGYACFWSIEQITGEPIPEMQPWVLAAPTGQFLTPLD